MKKRKIIYLVLLVACLGIDWFSLDMNTNDKILTIVTLCAIFLFGMNAAKVEDQEM